MSYAEMVVEEMKTLPDNSAAKVLDFVKSLKQKEIDNIENYNETDDSWFERGEPCPICAKHRDPETVEMRFKEEVMAGMQEVEDMISGKIPTKWYNSLDEMLNPRLPIK